jgi:hypothetical protein
MNLPPDVDCLTDAQLFIWRPRGVLDAGKTNQILAFVTEQETKFGRSFNRFTDLSALDAVDLTFKYVFQVALYRRLSRQGQETIKSAFFVTNPEAAHYVRLHAVLTDHSPLKVALFKERAAAAKWLGVSAELLEVKT